MNTPLELLDRMTKAIGGRKRLQSLCAIKYEGTITIGTMSGTFSLVLDAKAYRRHQAFDLKVFSETTRCNGTISWRVDENGKLTTRTDPDAVLEAVCTTRFQAWDYLLHPEEYDVTVTETGQEVQARITYHAHHDKPFASETLSVDPQTGLLLKEERLVDGLPDITTYSDYRDIEGIQMPSTWRTLSGGNEITIQFQNVLLNPPIEERLFQPPESQDADYAFPAGKWSVVVPLQIPLHHLLTEVRIGGNAYQFLVDTGAGKSVISTQLAQELNLASLGEMSGVGISGTQQFPIAHVPELCVGDVRLLDQKIVVADFAKTIHAVFPGVQGILGMDFLNRFVIKVDYIASVMEIYDRDHFAYDGNGETIALDGTYYVMSIDGRQGKFNVDTGGVSLSLHAPFVKANRLLVRPEQMPSATRIAGGGNTALTSYKALCRQIQIGRFTLENVPVDMADTAVGAFADEVNLGNAGSLIWRKFHIWFDFTGNRMILEPNENFAAPFFTDRCGLDIRRKDGRYIVEAVTTHTPAAASGIVQGDELVSIDDMSAAALPLAELSRKFYEPAGATYHLVFRTKDGAEKACDITLNDYRKYYDEYQF